MSSSQLEIAVKEHVAEIKREAISRARRGSNILRNSALQVLSQETHGRVYRYGVASVAGATPNPQTGSLRRNWQELPVAISGDLRIKIAIRSDVFYQKFLEYGTSKMAPRPHMKKIRDKAKPQIAALFANL